MIATIRESFIAKFFRLEAAGGILLMLAALAALICANSPLAGLYSSLLKLPVEVRVGALEIAKPLLLWINDGLMAVFFFLIGLELKREVLEGELSDKRNIVLPGIGALGGMAVPALVYILVYMGLDATDPVVSRGWAIPAATDIAFALGVLSLLGPRVPNSLKIFLTSLAIFDDIGAILIIAMFYTSKISGTALAVSAGCIVVLALFSKRRVESTSLYVLMGAIMWVATLKSGVHATLAGVVLALFIPIKSKENPDYSPLKTLEHDLHGVVAFFVLPLFAFANAGINLAGLEMEQLLHSVPVGVALGLFAGKQVGVFGMCWLAIKLKWSSLPKGMTWGSLYGLGALCGIGFTMSLFIGSLAFEDVGERIFDERLGIIIGSLASGILGFQVLRRSLGPPASE